MSQEIIFGCIVDQHSIDEAVDIVDRAINGLSKDDPSVNIDDLIELYNSRGSLRVSVWTISLSEIDTRYYIFGIGANDFHEDKTLREIRCFIRDEVLKILKKEFEVGFRVIEENDEMSVYETYRSSK